MTCQFRMLEQWKQFQKVWCIRRSGTLLCFLRSVAIRRRAHHDVTIYKMVFGDNGTVTYGCFQRTASGGDSPQSRLHVPNWSTQSFGTFLLSLNPPLGLIVHCHVSLFSGNNSYPNYILCLISIIPCTEKFVQNTFSLILGHLKRANSNRNTSTVSI